MPTVSPACGTCPPDQFCPSFQSLLTVPIHCLLTPRICDVAVNTTESPLASVATAVCTPKPLPSVQVVAARPVESDKELDGLTLLPALSARHVTVAPGTTLLN